ncbi:hypothetical protein SAMN02745172_00073 [Pseudoxanthobacter soli DSM 19599]|uniref:Permuted papain-like amidase enzyme, YaeF/YiiX, C92 family n=1 Tax=Pseudoxanthobacter soli DSM 19599 TaxID=1123029 RepID=A0A1M7Z4L8_9HYPH|nr:hypothetical protein [Pseudoxanthobacter soli]SHO59809.1 hypothetical protein SAMN02745172_00073 [Pseudoxanthobacter soli DSM 19599]
MFGESYFKELFRKPATKPGGPIQPGDILIKHVTLSGIGLGILAGQAVGSAGLDARWVHAGIATSHDMIAEMDGHGLQHNCLATTDREFKYRVFRTAHRNVAIGACETAKMLLGFHANAKGRLTYSLSGAAKSITLSTNKVSNTDRINKILDALLSGRDVSLFCSELVVLCYLVALEQSSLLPRKQGASLPAMSQFFAYEPKEYSPAYLHEMLCDGKSLFSYVGDYQGMKWL